MAIIPICQRLETRERGKERTYLSDRDDRAVTPWGRWVGEESCGCCRRALRGKGRRGVDVAQGRLAGVLLAAVLSGRRGVVGGKKGGEVGLGAEVDDVESE